MNFEIFWSVLSGTLFAALIVAVILRPRLEAAFDKRGAEMRAEAEAREDLSRENRETLLQSATESVEEVKADLRSHQNGQEAHHA